MNASKRLSDFLDALSDHHLSIRGKSMAPASIWWHERPGPEASGR